MSNVSPGHGRGLRVASPQDFAGGLFLITIGLGAYWASSNLAMGTLGAMGPGMLPRSLSVITGAIGLIILVGSFRIEGPPLDGWSIRGLFFVLLGTCLFALTIRGTDGPGILDFPAIGLIAAGPLVAVVSSIADPETNWKEVLIFATFMTALCAGLFKYSLGLPIPLAPWLLGY